MTDKRKRFRVMWGETMNSQLIFDEESEQAVLGCMMEEAKTIPIIARILESSKIFYLKSHQIIFDTICEVYENSQSGDIRLIAKKIKDNNQTNRIGGIEYLYDILTRVVDTQNADYYAEIVKENYIRRRMIKISKQIGNMALETEKDLTDVVDKATQIVSELTIKPVESKYLPDIMRKTYEMMEFQSESEEEPMETGYDVLDRNHTVNEKGTMTSIIADSGGGKTTFLRNVMLNRFAQGFKVLMFPTEITEERMAVSFYSMLSGIPHRALKRKNKILSQEQWEQLSKIRERVDDMRGWIESGNVSVEYIKNRTREIKMNEDLDCLIIDYIQNIYANKFTNNRSLQLDYIINQIRGLAVELDINIWIASQLTMQDRRGQKGKKRDKTWGEGAWSGGIRNNSDVMINLRSTDLDPREADINWNGRPDPGILEIIQVKIEKDRDAEYPISYPIVFDKPVLQMRDASREEQKFFYKEWMDIEI